MLILSKLIKQSSKKCYIHYMYTIWITKKNMWRYEKKKRKNTKMRLKEIVEYDKKKYNKTYKNQKEQYCKTNETKGAVRWIKL